jgi:hypothetical protein
MSAKSPITQRNTGRSLHETISGPLSLKDLLTPMSPARYAGTLPLHARIERLLGQPPLPHSPIRASAMNEEGEENESQQAPLVAPVVAIPNTNSRSNGVISKWLPSKPVIVPVSPGKIPRSRGGSVSSGSREDMARRSHSPSSSHLGTRQSQEKTTIDEDDSKLRRVSLAVPRGRSIEGAATSKRSRSMSLTMSARAKQVSVDPAEVGKVLQEYRRASVLQRLGYLDETQLKQVAERVLQDGHGPKPPLDLAPPSDGRDEETNDQFEGNMTEHMRISPIAQPLGIVDERTSASPPPKYGESGKVGVDQSEVAKEVPEVVDFSSPSVDAELNRTSSVKHEGGTVSENAQSAIDYTQVLFTHNRYAEYCRLFRPVSSPSSSSSSSGAQGVSESAPGHASLMQPQSQSAFSSPHFPRTSSLWQSPPPSRPGIYSPKPLDAGFHGEPYSGHPLVSPSFANRGGSSMQAPSVLPSPHLVGDGGLAQAQLVSFINQSLEQLHVATSLLLQQHSPQSSPLNGARSLHPPTSTTSNQQLALPPPQKEQENLYIPGMISFLERQHRARILQAEKAENEERAFPSGKSWTPSRAYSTKLNSQV